MSEHWTPKALSALARYANGFAFKPHHWTKEGLPIVRIEQLNNPEGEYDFFLGYVPPDNLIDDGDLIFSWSATLKVALWRHGKAALNQHLFKVVPTPDTDKEFLFQLLDHHMDALAGGAHGSTMKHIKRGELDKYLVNVPERDEQTLIARVLRALDSQIESTEAMIAKQKQVRTGLMQNLFIRGVNEHGQLRPPCEQAPRFYQQTQLGWLPLGWEVEAYGRRIDVIDPNPTHRYPDEAEEGVPICSTENFDGEDEFDISFAKHVPESAFNYQNNRCRYHPLDVIFARKGRIGLARRYGNGRKAFSHTVVAMKPLDKTINHSWVLWLARSSAFISGISRNMNSNSGVPTLGVEFIKSIPVPFPPKSEQEIITAILDEASKSVSMLEDDLFKLRLQKSGLMQDLLTSKVSVAPLLEGAAT
jgi:type I restriction enzyme S subunit